VANLLNDPRKNHQYHN